MSSRIPLYTRKYKEGIHWASYEIAIYDSFARLRFAVLSSNSLTVFYISPAHRG